MAICCSFAAAEDNAVLKGGILGVDGKAVKGSFLLVYSSANVKKRADFMSARTEADGKFRMVLPPGKYWAIARWKKTADYGPLMPGDKHSGEPVEIDVAAGVEREMKFTVVDIKDSAYQKDKIRADYIRIKGKIVDAKGQPVKNAYAIANRNETFSALPDYLSAWTGDDGYYSLYIPRGKYYIGAATAFPPGKNYLMNKEITVESEKSDVDIIGR